MARIILLVMLLISASASPSAREISTPEDRKEWYIFGCTVMNALNIRGCAELPSGKQLEYELAFRTAFEQYDPAVLALQKNDSGVLFRVVSARADDGSRDIVVFQAVASGPDFTTTFVRWLSVQIDDPLKAKPERTVADFLRAERTTFAFAKSDQEGRITREIASDTMIRDVRDAAIEANRIQAARQKASTEQGMVKKQIKAAKDEFDRGKLEHEKMNQQRATVLESARRGSATSIDRADRLLDISVLPKLFFPPVDSRPLAYPPHRDPPPKAPEPQSSDPDITIKRLQ